jgi:hypothetical protein
VAPERNREADESEIIHDTKIVSPELVRDIGHITASMKQCRTFRRYHAECRAREQN